MPFKRPSADSSPRAHVLAALENCRFLLSVGYAPGEVDTTEIAPRQQLQRFVNTVMAAVSRLDDPAQMIIRQRYLTVEEARDEDVRAAVGCGRTDYYRLKARAIEWLAADLFGRLQEAGESAAARHTAAKPLHPVALPRLT
jgi:hypothetical protein